MNNNNTNILPIHRRDVTSGIVDTILVLISEGNWEPGEQLPSQRELASLMGVSMASLREALYSLQAMGVLEMRHGAGTFVSEHTANPGAKLIELSLNLSGKDVEMFFEARGIIETGLASLAAEHATNEQIEKLMQILADQLDNLESEQNEPLHDLDLEFHQQIALMADNKFLSQINGTLFNILEELFRALPLTKDGWLLHQAVANAIRDRSPSRAYTAMKNLIEASSKNYYPYMKESKNPK